MLTQGMKRDANRVAIQGLNSLLVDKTVAFTGAAGLGAQGTIPLFTVTGDVIAQVIGVCSENLAGASATIEVGVTGYSNGLLGNKTATNIDADGIWVQDDLNFLGKIGTPAAITRDIIATVATADITDGTLTFYCFWYPLSDDGNVVAA